MTIQQDYQLRPHVEREFTATGIIGPSNGIPLNMTGNVRVAVENVGGSNAVQVQGRLVGQSSWVTVQTITSSSTGTTVDMSVYDEVRFNCSVYSASGGTPKLLASGFFKRGGSTAPSGFGFYGQQTGNTVIDVGAPLSSDTTVNIALDAADYEYGVINLVIPASGTFSSGTINAAKRRTYAHIYFATTLNDAYSILTNPFTYTVYPGYDGTSFVPYGYTYERDTFLSPQNFGATGAFTGGAPTAPLIRIKSVRINGANIELVFNNASGSGGALIFDADWRVWKTS